MTKNKEISNAVIILGETLKDKVVASFMVGGLTLLEREIIGLYYQGIKNVFLLTKNEKYKDYKPQREMDGFKFSVVDSLSNLKSSFLLLRGDMIFHKDFMSKGKTLKGLNVFTGEKEDGRKGSILSTGIKTSAGFYAGISVIDSENIEKLNEYLNEDLINGDLKFISENSQQENIQKIPNKFFYKPEDIKDSKRGEKLLFQSLKKAQDGIVARTFNRPLSLPVSRILANFSLTPNQLSVINGFLAIFSAFFLMFGHSLLGLSFYISGALGGLFIQMCSIYDGCDGEIARVKYQYTHFGDWLDTIIDDITNCMFFAGVAVWSYYYTGDTIYIYMGIAAFIGQWVANFAMYYYLIKVAGTGNNQDYKVGSDGGIISAIVGKLKYLTKRDFHLFTFFVISLFGKLHYAAYAICAFAVTIGTILGVQHIILLIKGVPETK
jgi:phosphatidylglycerophosphate synthase